MGTFKLVKLIDPLNPVIITGGLVPRGAYNAGTDYAVGDTVTYAGTSYVMYADAPSGTTPTNTTYWQVLAGTGLPTGGTTGQVLAKNSSSNYDVTWLDVSGMGDMQKLVYDTDNDGVVDNAEALQGQGGSYYLARSNHTGSQTASTISDFATSVSANTDVAANTAARHTHANKTLLDTYTQTEVNLADAVTKKHDALTLGTNTATALSLSGQQLSLADVFVQVAGDTMTGALLIKKTSDAASVFEVQNSAGVPIFSVDAINFRAGFGRNDPQAKFHIYSSTDELLRLEDSDADGNPYLTFFQANTRRSFIQHSDTSDTLFLVSEYGDVSIKAASTAGTDTDTTYLTVKAGGNIGINTATISDRLELVDGTSGATSNTSYNGITVHAAANAGLQLLAPNTSVGIITFGDPEDNDIGRILYRHSSNRLDFETNTALAMVIDSSQKVGIGATTLTEHLEVGKDGDAFSNYIRVQTDNASTYAAGLKFGFGGVDYGLIDIQFDTRTTDGIKMGGNSSATAYPVSITQGGSTRIFLTTTGRLGFNTSSPATFLDVNGASTFRTGATFVDINPEITGSTANGWWATIHQSGTGGGGQNAFRRADGTSASPTNVKSGMSLGSLSFRGYDGTSFGGSKALIIVQATEDWTSTANGTNYQLQLTPAGSTSPVTVHFIKDNGYHGFGTSAPTAVIDINSDVLRLRTAKTPATAGATGNAGDICWDSSYVYVCIATNTWRRIAHATW